MPIGFLDKTFQKLKIEAEKALEEYNKELNNNNNNDMKTRSPTSSIASLHTGGSAGSNSAACLNTMTMCEVMHYSSNATRWEKTVVATDAVLAEVTNFDPDGVEIVCVGGYGPNVAENEEIEWHEGIQGTQCLEETITQKEPGGPCPLGKAMEAILDKELERDLANTPCSILVLTAGKPDDAELLEESLRKASQTVADHGGIDHFPLTITFIQIGDDPEASEYLTYLDKKMHGIIDENQKKVDIVDTMSYEELQKTVKSMREFNQTLQKPQGAQGAILGAVTGAAMGVGGMLAGRNKNRSTWDGTWNCYLEDEKVATVTVEDDERGNMKISGLHEETMQGVYHRTAPVDSEKFFIQFTETRPEGEVIEGQFEKGVLKWSNGTRWEPKTKWGGVLGAATVGAALVGATGYAIQKKFFQTIKAEKTCDYVLVLDRSEHMCRTDKRQVRRKAVY